jgi:AraC family transcriptional regulator
MGTAPSDCRWDSDVLARACREWSGFAMHVIARRTVGTHEFDLRSPTHVLSLPLAGDQPILEGRLASAPTRFAMQSGHAMLRPADRRFRGVSRGAGTFRYAMLWIDPSFIARATDGRVDAATEIPPALDLAHPAIVCAMESMARQVVAPAPGGRLQAESLATAILTELVRHRLVGDPAFRAVVGRTAVELGRFVDYVEAHLGEDVSLFTLAAVAGLSPSHLVRELRRTTGLSPHQYVLRRRAERARRLLARLELGLGEVALAVGLSSQAHLNLVFRRVYGITPGGYRARYAR